MGKPNWAFNERELVELMKGDNSWLANLANAAAFLYWKMDDVNWVGFYLLDRRSQQLTLGPFQGLPACSKINIGEGVCGTAVQEKRTILVDDVEKFPDHIVCDPSSQSELVIPMIKEKEVIGVLDIDSPLVNRFDSQEKEYLERMVQIIIDNLNCYDYFILDSRELE